MLTIILDTMGGDRGPGTILEGAIRALPDMSPQSELVLVGDENAIRPLLARRRFRPLADALASGRVRIVHAAETIGMEDSIRAVRRKPNASINVGCMLAAESYQKRAQAKAADPRATAAGGTAFVSTGHSGAVMASALFHMGRLKGAERPAIAVKLPTLSSDGCVVLDVGANVDCKPEHLRDFAIMGGIFAQVGRKQTTLPKVGLLSNGEEKSKGNELTRAALELIEPLPCFQAGAPDRIGEFVGYAEGKEIFKGQVDAVVTDGFVGNVVLKAVEGLGSAVTTILKREARGNPLALLGFLLAAGVFRQLKRKLDYAEYGAAPLLGVAGYAFICHGRSNAKAIRSAVLRAQSALQCQLVERLELALRVAAGERAKPSTG